MKNFYLDRPILVVDDEPFILKTTAVVLQNLGFNQVQTASSVNQAIERLTHSSIALIITDLKMPQKDGLALLKELDEIEFLGDIILFSGVDDQTLKMAENLAYARDLSVLGSLSKPVNSEALFALLEQSPVKKHQSNSAAATNPSISFDQLRLAIENREFEPWFQPKVDMRTQQPVGLEMLARWPRNVYGKPVFPDEFIPLVESYDLVDELTFSLAEQTDQFARAWRRHGIDLKVAINLSMDSLTKSQFPELFCDRLSSLCEDVSKFQLEVTESRFAENLVRPLEALLRFRMKGISLSIDDFGTGHSNLSQLRDLPFNELKLDKSYVNPEKKSDKTDVILQSTVRLAKELGMLVVAEGVETLEDWHRMETLGCDHVQGYFIAKPMQGAQMVDWVRNWPQLQQCLFSD